MVDPLPAPVDSLNGAVVEFTPRRRKVFIGGALPSTLPGSELYRGGVLIRLAMPFVYEPDAFYLQRIVDDFGRDFRGQDAIDFAYHKGDAYPRASVFGIRASSGQDEQIFLKQLDLARAKVPIAYANEIVSVPIGQLDTALWIESSVASLALIEEGDASFPQALIEVIPCYRIPPDQLGHLAQHLFP